MAHHELPVPPHFNTDKVGEVWRVPYQERAEEAARWAKAHHIPPAEKDKFRICLVLVDMQNTFCIPGFELYVGGRSGTGAVDDSRRLCPFIYRNLNLITRIVPTMDTHHALQIFHSIYLVNEKGEQPKPYTLISEEDVKQGIWRFNAAVSQSLGITEAYGQRHLCTRAAAEGGGNMISPYGPIMPCWGVSAMPWSRQWRRRSFSMEWPATASRTSM